MDGVLITGARDGAQPRVSAVVCAYNEAARIARVLAVLAGHPRLHEVIVVDDGSTDATAAIVAAHPGVRLISYAPNRGKAHALAQGVAAACGDYLLLADADLSGMDAGHVDALVEPVLSGWADATLSLRANTLWLYSLIGLDFVSGERVLPAWLLREALDGLQDLRPWGAEAYINDLIIREQLRIAVVDWPDVRHAPKTEKVGPLKGAVEDLKMIRDAVTTLTPLGVVRQNVSLLRLKTAGARPPS
ncbi:glycosyltransferase family 2 protein [Phenylobacterium sp.]|jgi:glycosyltransferase involved in cell wall biosynthesis|uniref:glycosyltransferase family 2 protein n=1 Tax=Phenylobacterium sp. TaxID=1871053 RepID=UPI002F93D3BB